MINKIVYNDDDIILNDGNLYKINETSLKYSFRYFKKYFGLNIEDYLDIRIKRCAWCDRVPKVKKFKLDINNNILLFNFVTNDFTCKGRKNISCERNNLNNNSIEYVSKSKNINKEEAKRLIHDRNKTPFYIENHNSEEDYIKYQTRDRTWFDSDEDYIKYKELLSYSHSIDYLLEKHGEEAYSIREKINKSKGITLEKMISKYGVYLGLEKYTNWLDSIKITENNFIKKYGEEEGKKKFKKLRKQRKESYYIYKNKYSDDEWEKKKKEHAITLEKMISKYGEKIGKIKYNTWLEKVSNISNVSKESHDNIFNEIYNYCITLNIKEDDIYYGIYNKEYFIYDSLLNKYNLYDFTIPMIKLIIEYHGEIFHYNERIHNINESNPFGVSFKKLKIKDDYKRKLAIKNGFTIIEIFSDSIFNKEINKIKEIIYERIKKHK